MNAPDPGPAVFAATVIIFALCAARGCAIGADERASADVPVTDAELDAGVAAAAPWPDVVEEPIDWHDAYPDPAGTVLEWPAPPCDQYVEPCPQEKLPARR